jgi:hydroxymethylpyrimidine pyrophosphatase-like HAD family hydrolase
MSKYEAIVFDIDGTAVPNMRGGMPSARLLEVVAANKRKIHLIAATGRPIEIALPVIDRLGLIAPSIVSGGAIILEAKSHSVLKHTPLPKATVRQVFQILENLPYGVYLRDDKVNPKIYMNRSPIYKDVEIIYITTIPAEEAAGLLGAISQIPLINASTVPDWESDGLSINITHVEATKEHGVADVLRRLNVSKSATIGVGDGDNDIHLFRSVGLKVAMGNATPDLKADADLIVASVDEDGLADIIESYAN